MLQTLEGIQQRMPEPALPIGEEIDFDFYEMMDEESFYPEEDTLFYLDKELLRQITLALKVELPVETEINRLVDRIRNLITSLKAVQEVPSIVQALSTDKELAWCLLVLIKCSGSILADKIEMGASAANAITALNYARFNFSARDLSNIQIEGADLTRGLLHHTNLSGSDLSEVTFAQAYMAQANLTHVTLRETYWGQEPDLIFPKEIWDERIKHCAYSSDGRWVASCTTVALYIWCTETSKLRERITLKSLLGCQRGEGGKLFFLLFLAHDKQLIAVSKRREATMAVFEINGEGKVERSPLQPEWGKCQDIAFHKGNLWGVYLSGSKVTIYAFATQNEIGSFTCPDSIEKLTLHPSQETAWLVGKTDSALLLWDLGSSQKPFWQLEGKYSAYAISSEEQWLATAKGGESSIVIWEIRTQSCLRCIKTLAEHIAIIAFSTEGQWLACSGWNDWGYPLQVWDRKTYSSYATFYFPEIAFLSFHPQGTSLICGGNSPTIVYQRSLSAPPGVFFSSPKPSALGQLMAVDFASTPEKHVWLDKAMGTVTFYQAKNPVAVLSLSDMRGFYGECEDAEHGGCLSLKGEWYAHGISTGKHTEIEIWKVQNTPMLYVSLKESEFTRIKIMAIAPTQQLLVVSGFKRNDWVLELWNMASQQWERLLEGPVSAAFLSSLTFSANEEFLYVSDEVEVWRWDMQGFQVTQITSDIYGIEPGWRNAFSYMHCSDKHLIATDVDGVIVCWNVTTQQKEWSVKTTLHGYSFAGLGAGEEELIVVHKNGTRLTWRKQRVSNEEHFILSSDVCPERGFYIEGADITQAKELSLKSQLLLAQEKAVGLPQKTPFIEKEKLVCLQAEDLEDIENWLSLLEECVAETERPGITGIAQTFLPGFATQRQTSSIPIETEMGNLSLGLQTRPFSKKVDFPLSSQEKTQSNYAEFLNYLPLDASEDEDLDDYAEFLNDFPLATSEDEDLDDYNEERNFAEKEQALSENEENTSGENDENNGSTYNHSRKRRGI